MFVDAPAIVAIMTDEAEAAALVARLDEASAPVTSAIALFEAAHALSRKRRQPLARSRDQLQRFLTLSGIVTVPIAGAESSEALVAAERFGRGTGHPARLNMSDCFA